jgi:crotonobetainyl-CoA:carnitine CoA-transferase CaiB-like acyl-CoA transferase
MIVAKQTLTVFKNLKVVEFSSVLAGPAVGMFFAELGAQVIKIENKTTGGDVTRSWKLPSETKEASISAYWCSVNWGKQHLFLDLNDPIDLQKAIQLSLEADVLISNFKPSAAQRWRIDAETLCHMNPRLIYAQLSAYADPEDESPAFDVVLQAEAGFLFMNGQPGGPPVKMPVALIDLLAAHQLKEAILIALLQREQTGKGAIIRSSLLESALSSLANQASNYLMTGHIPQKMGSAHPNIAPYGDTFTCADGIEIVLAVGTERQFSKLCISLHAEHLLEIPVFKTNTLRVQHRQTLNTHLSEAIQGWNSQELLELFKKSGVPAGKIRDMKSVFEMPEAQSMILREMSPDGAETKRIKTIAFNIQATK